MDGSPDYMAMLKCNRMERDILSLMLGSETDLPWWWHIEDVMHETDDPIIALDAMASLCAAGLLQRRGDYLLITRAALKFHQLIT
jgi:hypothetical protein